MLKHLIVRHYNEPDFMELVFSAIAEFPPERRLQFIATFIENNKSLNDFKRLPLEPRTFGWSGSAVPMLQTKVEYFESMLPIMNSVELLHHKQYVEQQIDGIRLWIEREKKQEFMEH